MRISDWSSDVCSSDLVDLLRRLEAIVAVAAALGRMLAEMAQQQRAATLDRLDQRAQRIEPRPLARDARLGQLSQPHPRPREILGAPQHQRLGGVAIAPRTSGFLIIALDRKSPRLNSSHYCASRIPLYA